MSLDISTCTIHSNQFICLDSSDVHRHTSMDMIKFLFYKNPYFLVKGSYNGFLNELSNNFFVTITVLYATTHMGEIKNQNKLG